MKSYRFRCTQKFSALGKLRQISDLARVSNKIWLSCTWNNTAFVLNLSAWYTLISKIKAADNSGRLDLDLSCQMALSYGQHNYRNSVNVNVVVLPLKKCYDKNRSYRLRQYRRIRTYTCHTTSAGIAALRAIRPRFFQGGALAARF